MNNIRTLYIIITRQKRSGKISNKDPSLFTKYTFLQDLLHTSLITRRFENIIVDQFSLEFSIGKKIHKREEERIPRRTAIDVKMINDARLINIILNSMPLEIAPHTLLSFKKQR